MAYLFSQLLTALIILKDSKKKNKIQLVCLTLHSRLHCQLIPPPPPPLLLSQNTFAFAFSSFSTLRLRWGVHTLVQSKWNNSTECHTCLCFVLYLVHLQWFMWYKGRISIWLGAVCFGHGGYLGNSVLVWGPYGHIVYFPPTACTSCCF